jgi:hypothetical protein
MRSRSITPPGESIDLGPLNRPPVTIDSALIPTVLTQVIQQALAELHPDASHRTLLTVGVSTGSTWCLPLIRVLMSALTRPTRASGVVERTKVGHNPVVSGLLSELTCWGLCEVLSGRSSVSGHANGSRVFHGRATE